MKRSNHCCQHSLDRAVLIAPWVFVGPCAAGGRRPARLWAPARPRCSAWVWTKWRSTSRWVQHGIARHSAAWTCLDLGCAELSVEQVALHNQHGRSMVS